MKIAQRFNAFQRWDKGGAIFKSCRATEPTGFLPSLRDLSLRHPHRLERWVFRLSLRDIAPIGSPKSPQNALATRTRSKTMRP
jgi:hypothetical protein